MHVGPFMLDDMIVYALFLGLVGHSVCTVNGTLLRGPLRCDFDSLNSSLDLLENGSAAVNEVLVQALALC